MSAISTPQVAILMGSTSDSEVMQPCREVLDQFGVGYECLVRSAHRAPAAVAEFSQGAKARGIKNTSQM